MTIWHLIWLAGVWFEGAPDLLLHEDSDEGLPEPKTAAAVLHLVPFSWVRLYASLLAPLSLLSWTTSLDQNGSGSHNIAAGSDA